MQYSQNIDKKLSYYDKDIAIIIVDKNFAVKKCNTHFEDMFLYPIKEIKNKSIKNIINNKNFITLKKFSLELNSKLISITIQNITAIDKNNKTIAIEINLVRNDSKYFTLFIYEIYKKNKYINKLQYLAYYDQLTKIPNRTLFLDRAETAIRQAKRNNEIIAVLYIDLDEFKSINDNNGHEVGDVFLYELSMRFKEYIRESDTLSRIGGDEFAILMPNISNKDDATKLAERIIDSNHNSIDINNVMIYPKTSIGISIFPDDGDNIKILLKKSDSAMYKAKQSKGNSIFFY